MTITSANAAVESAAAPGSAPANTCGQALWPGASAVGPSRPTGNLENQSSPAFPRFPGETPRAYSAFMAYFNLGQARSLQAVADKTGENLSTLKNWSAKHDWLERLQSFNAGLLQQQAHDEAERQRKQAANWAERLNRFREQEWDAAQKLLAAAQCFLESFGDDALQKMTLSQVSRALSISSKIGRSALLGAELSPSTESAVSPIQQQLLDAVKRLYGQPAPDRDPSRVAAPASPAPDRNPSQLAAPQS